MNGIHAVPSSVHFVPTAGSYGPGKKFRKTHVAQGVHRQLRVVLDVFRVFPFICHLGHIVTSRLH